MLNNLVEKLDNVHDQQIWTELEAIKRDQMDMLENFLNMISDLKNSFDGSISRLDTAKKRKIVL